MLCAFLGNWVTLLSHYISAKKKKDLFSILLFSLYSADSQLFPDIMLDLNTAEFIRVLYRSQRLRVNNICKHQKYAEFTTLHQLAAPRNLQLVEIYPKPAIL